MNKGFAQMLILYSHAGQASGIKLSRNYSYLSLNRYEYILYPLRGGVLHWRRGSGSRYVKLTKLMSNETNSARILT